MKKYKCIIFDLDGTILDTEEMNIVPLRRLIKEELGKDIAYEKLLKYRAYPGKQTLKLLGFNKIDQAYDKWVTYVNEYEVGAKLYEGFNEVLQILNESGVVSCISSSKTKKQYEIDFCSTGLQKYIKNAVLAEDTENHKPHPEPILKVMENLDVKASDIIYIGDTIADYRATRMAGIDFALALWGAYTIEGIDADYNLSNPKEILKFI
ncbi:HAD-IA family hydrolase [uncultured Clostridium sp.]|uniref:HAD family hydrolase n=1 Tax=uncultured Clostridium sp. TaxID=59620 RepID=UPI002618D94B|nr:HAD-IA family hydrolase [uncultured Clostridium sp.]